MATAPQKEPRSDKSADSVNESATPASVKGKAKKQASHDREIDRQLVERVNAGDRQAFRKLDDRHHGRAYAVALGVVKNPSDARDVVQEAFVKVHRHLIKFKGSSSFYTWLYRIVMNLSIDHIRRAKRKRSLDYDDGVQRGEDEIAGDGAILPRILDGDPSKAALRKELGGALNQALDQLPEHHRAVLLLREVEGMSYDQMAEVLEVPKGTIMSRLFHARRKMQESLAAYLSANPNEGNSP